MTHCSYHGRVAALLALGAMAGPVAGQAAAPGPAESPAGASSHWGIGVGIHLKREAYKGMGSSTTAIPLLSYENKWLRFAGPALDLKLPLTTPVSLALRARYAFEDGYTSAQSSALYGMAERKRGVWLGAALGWRGRHANASAELLADAGDHSGGRRARASIDTPLRAGSVLVSPRIAASWVDADYVDYYYGVRTSEARPGRAAYAGDSALNAELGVRAAYRLSASHSMYADASITRLGDAIANSPLVARSHERAVRLGYLYQFQ